MARCRRLPCELARWLSRLRFACASGGGHGAAEQRAAEHSAVSLSLPRAAARALCPALDTSSFLTERVARACLEGNGVRWGVG